MSTGAGDLWRRRGWHGDHRTIAQLGKRLELLEAIDGWWLALTPDFAEHAPCCPAALGYTVDGRPDCCCPSVPANGDTAMAGSS